MVSFLATTQFWRVVWNRISSSDQNTKKQQLAVFEATKYLFAKTIVRAILDLLEAIMKSKTTSNMLKTA